MNRKANIWFVFVVVLTIGNSWTINAAKTISNHLSDTDLQRLQQVFRNGVESNDIQSIYYGGLNVNDIKQNERENACRKITQLHQDSKLNDFEKNLYLVGSYKALLCPNRIPEAMQATLVLTKEFSTTQEMYFNLLSTKAMSNPIKDDVKTALVKNIQTILKKDDSLSSLGYAFHVAAELGKAGEPICDWIEGAIAQADEIDGKMLQFEGGLSITALLLNGAFKLTSAQGKPAPITEDQSVKFINYLLSRRSVQLAKGASVLIEVLQTISKNSQLSPVSIQIVGNGNLQPDSAVVNIKIVNILGGALTTPAITTVSAAIISKPGNTILQKKIDLISRNSENTIFALDLTKLNLARGSYVLDITAGPHKHGVQIRILGKVKVTGLEIGVGEIDSTSAVKKQSVQYPQKLTNDLNADAQQKIVLRATLIDETDGKPLSVHQAFIRLENVLTNEEIIFVTEQDSTKAYKFDLDVGARSSEFSHKSGQYKLEFIVGDASLSNSFKWLVANVHLKFSQEPKSLENSKTLSVRPEIIHQFREPEIRPTRIVSDLFTGLCAAPFIVLFFLWAKLNVNVSNFPFTLSSIGFHLGFGSILSLFGVFFWQLNMFDTIRYLLPLSLITFFCGNRLLRSIANGKQQQSQ